MPPVTEEGAGNNLSYPAAFTAGPITLRGDKNDWTLDGVYSYGCAKPEGIYPNTSCVGVNELGEPVPMDEAECEGEDGPCWGYDAERIYWQQDDDNYWQAGWKTGATETASHLDWADNLESVSWSVLSIIRVETTPFVDHGSGVTERGFQMWHVFGQGPNEMWGVRATNPQDDSEPVVPYVYDSPYAIIHDATAKLLLTKLPVPEDFTNCPTAPGEVPTFAVQWNDGTHTWDGDGAWNAPEIAYTTELNIGGKIVYGYNWRVSSTYYSGDKSGWWRLTFYTSDDKILFATAVTFSPPPLPPPSVGVAVEEGGLYEPAVDVENNLTYIDICLTSTRGGGRRGGPGGPGAPSAPGGPGGRRP